MGKRVAGICYIKVDGVQLEVKGDIEVPGAPTKRETVVGTAGPAGLYKEEVNVPYVKLKAIITSDFPLTQVTTGTNMTVTCEFPNGWVYTLSQAYLVDDMPINISEGEIDVRFDGVKGLWSGVTA